MSHATRAAYLRVKGVQCFWEMALAWPWMKIRNCFCFFSCFSSSPLLNWDNYSVVDLYPFFWYTWDIFGWGRVWDCQGFCKLSMRIWSFALTSSRWPFLRDFHHVGTCRHIMSNSTRRCSTRSTELVRAQLAMRTHHLQQHQQEKDVRLCRTDDLPIVCINVAN